MSLFKITTSPAPTNPKIGDTEFKEFYAAINRNTDWASIEPFLQQAEMQYIIPYISQEFYDVLETEYQSSGTIADTEKAYVFRLLRIAIAHYTIYEAMPQLNLRIADGGVLETTNQDAAPVRQWVFKQSRWEVNKKAYYFLDMALNYMEEQVEAGNADFDAFKNSSTYTITKDLLIPNATVFSQYYNIANSRKSYVAMRPYIRKAQLRYIKPILCELYDEVLSEFQAGTLTAENAALIPYIQQLLAEHAIIESQPDISIVNDGGGWKVIEDPDATAISIQVLQSMIQNLLTKAEANAAAFKVQLENFIYENLSDYPTYEASDCNQIADADTIDTADWLEEDPPAGAVII